MSITSHRARALLGAVALLTAWLAAPAGTATIVNPNRALVDVQQQDDPTWIEHFPLQNFVSWDTILQTTGAMTYTGGTVRYRNAAGVVIRSFPVPPARFVEISRDRTPSGNQMLTLDGSGNAVIPAGANVLVPFSRELIDMNLVPATSEVEMCFDELETTPGACTNPIEVSDIALEEYRSPAAPTYIFPLRNPSQADNLTGQVAVGGNGHEIGTAHRFAINQRYAYDVGVQVSGSSRKNIDDTNDDYYVYGEFVLATQAGTVTVNEQGHPDNDPPDKLPGVGDCNATTCGDPLSCGPGEIPPGGNSVVIEHAWSEWTFLAHMIPGSNALTSCFDAMSQGDFLGRVGNSGNSTGPHVHVQTVNAPNASDNGARAFPMYFNNIEFSSTPTSTPRHQLDVAIPSNTPIEILDPPSFHPPNPTILTAAESEPNETLDQHGAIGLGATVFGVAENVADTTDVPDDIAVRGDGIEDLYRVFAPDPIDLHVRLTSPDAENLDVYVVTGDLRVQNPTGEGTRRLSSDEDVCIPVESGEHYLMVTSNDVTKAADASYELTVEEDSERVTVEIVEPVSFVDLGTSCEAIVEFEVTIEDGCCVDANALALDVFPLSPTGTVSFGTVTTDPPQVVSPSLVRVSGSVPAMTSGSCPFDVRILALAEDCEGSPIDERTLANATPFSMPGTANIYGAGRSVVPNPAGNGGGTLPVEVPLPMGVDRRMTFDGISGSIDFGGCCLPNGPDGIVAGGVSTANDWDGLSGMLLGRGRFLAAVFLDDEEPMSPETAQLDLTIPYIDFHRLSPGLRQIFFVGDGLTTEGDTQVFAVPDDATRVFFGVIDAGPPDNSLPGFYGDNSGTVTGMVVVSEGVPVPEPGLLAGLVGGCVGVAGAAVWRQRARQSGGERRG